MAQAGRVSPFFQSTEALVREEETPIYRDDAITELPVISISRTVGAQLCGRVDDAHLNATIISTALRLHRWLEIAFAVSIASIWSLFLITDIPTRTAMSYLSAASSAIVAVVLVASLSWDMMRLVSTSFEFWFILSIATANATLWCILFNDERAAAFVMAGVQFVLVTCVDANIYTRRMVIRSFVFSSPALVSGLALTAFRYPPDLYYPIFHIFGVMVDAVDLLVNGNLLLAYFTIFRAYRSKHLLLSSGPITWITCDVYFPVCHLVPQGQRLLAEEARRRASTLKAIHQHTDNDTKPLKLLEDTTAHGIDGRRILFPSLAHWIQQHVPTYALAVIRSVGLVSWMTALAWTLAGIRQDHASTSLPVYYLAILGLACSSVFAVIHLAHLQRNLIARILTDLDVWFISFQVGATTLGACDLMKWDTHRMHLLLTAWIWCHWVLFLDASSPFSRRRMAHTQRFVLLVDLLLVVYPLLLVYWLYFSHDRPRFYNRVLLDVPIGDGNIRVEMLGFVGSKLFTLWIWMGRFFWRELLRPADAFKLIKRRVFYRVNV